MTLHNKRSPLKIIATLVLAAILYGLNEYSGGSGTVASGSGSRAVADAFAARRSDVQMEVSGTIRKVLPDDNDGSRHQKFILQLDNDLTLLIAHNIDLADRVPAKEGDTLRVYGEYEWSEQGGVLHWTHRDRRGQHADGWIEFRGVRYE